jgi:hypothetical protein
MPRYSIRATEGEKVVQVVEHLGCGADAVIAHVTPVFDEFEKLIRLANEGAAVEANIESWRDRPSML